MFRIEDEGRIRLLTLDNPGRRNAIPMDRWSELARVLRDFEESDQRVLVVTGAGGDFCSGAELSAEVPLETSAERYESMRHVNDAARALHTSTKPTVAAVDGVAVGAGCNLALGCDLVIASDRARFSQIFVRRGLTVDFGGTWVLPRRVGLARAKELALSGRVIDAAEAVEYGLALEVVAVDDLMDRARAVAESLAAGAPLAQRFVKAAIDRSFELSFDEALALEAQAQTVCLSSEDALEGVAAFVQKRDPEFRGR
ncbi:MAG TPA: enoyl-CoA hydratase-related protein [Acidimicrobiia bacterium]|nr:enoyl-CoA hydratase-related protein [Acidimicrobiia bacterium]